MKTEDNIQGNVGNDGGNAGNSKEFQGNDEDKIHKRKDLPEIAKILAKKPELRRELINWVKREFGFNIESYLEEYFDELPDKKTKIEDIDIPLREIAQNVLQMELDGYSPSQIANFLGIYPSQVSRILKEKSRWEKEITKAESSKPRSNNKKLPFLLRLAARLKLI